MATDTARLRSQHAFARTSAARLLPPWWLLLITGIAWIVVSLIVFRFDYTTVPSIAVLFGVIAVAAGVVGRSAVLLVAWVAAFTLIRGVRDIVLAFRLREIERRASDDGSSATA